MIMKFHFEKKYIGKLFFSAALLWTVSAIFPTLLDLPLHSIMDNVDEYSLELIGDIWELPLYLISLIFLAFELPRLIDQLKHNSLYGILSEKEYPKWWFYVLLIFVVSWILARDSIVQYGVDYLSSMVCCNEPKNYRIAQAMSLRNLRRTVGVLDCLLPWLMLLRVNRRLMISTLLWLMGYIVCIYKWIALMAR